MFMKIKLPKKTVVSVIIAVIVFILVVVLLNSVYNCKQQPRTDFFVATNFLNDFEQITYDKNSCNIKSVTIPSSFNDVYQEFNNIQISQGFNLENYCGMNVEIYTFPAIYNEENVFVDVYVCKNSVIAADIFTVGIDGYMVPLK